MKNLSIQLKEKNLKVTPQRLSIYQSLCNTKEHPSAETIYKSIEEDFPTMSLATVYKTLDTLRKAKLIEELNVGEDSFRYDANIEPHYHFICKECNNVYDLMSNNNIHELKKELSQNNDIIIETEKIYFFGKCKDCIEHE